MELLQFYDRFIAVAGSGDSLAPYCTAEALAEAAKMEKHAAEYVKKHGNASGEPITFKENIAAWRKSIPNVETARKMLKALRIEGMQAGLRMDVPVEYTKTVNGKEETVVSNMEHTVVFKKLADGWKFDVPADFVWSVGWD